MYLFAKFMRRTSLTWCRRGVIDAPWWITHNITFTGSVFHSVRNKSEFSLLVFLLYVNVCSKSVKTSVKIPNVCVMFFGPYRSRGEISVKSCCHRWSNLGSVHQVPFTAGCLFADLKFAHVFFLQLTNASGTRTGFSQTYHQRDIRDGLYRLWKVYPNESEVSNRGQLSEIEHMIFTSVPPNLALIMLMIYISNVPCMYHIWPQHQHIPWGCIRSSVVVRWTAGQ